MSFLDRFKRKEPATQAPEARPDPAPKKIEPPTRQPAPALASGPVPRLRPAAKKEDRPPAGSSFVASPVRASEVHDMALELGDFLHRIPQNLLQPGPHDVHQVLRFKVDEMADRIGRGQTTIQLAEIFRQVPNIFRSETRVPADVEIRFPWQKVMMLLNQSRGARKGAAFTEAAANALSDKLKSKRPVRNIVPLKPEPPGEAAAPELKPAQSEAPAAPPVPIPPAATKATPPTDASLPAAPAPEDDDRLSREEILRARDVAHRSLLRVKGESERALAAARDERKAIADERDRIAAELERAKKEIHDKIEQAEFEKSVAARSAESLQKLVKERDALLQKKGSKPAETEPLREDHQQKIGELQQRLAELDDRQRGALEELAAEREKRAKLEETAATLRAELEAEARKRGAQFNVAIDELQGHLKTARDRHARLSAELDEAYSANAGSAAQLEEATAALRRDLEASAQKREAELTAELEQARAGQSHDTKELEEATVSLRSELEAAAREREGETQRALSALDQELAAANEQRKKLAEEIEDAKTSAARTLEETAAGLRRELQAASAGETEACATLAELEKQLALEQDRRIELAAELDRARSAQSDTVAALEERFDRESAKQVEEATAALRAEFDATVSKREIETQQALSELEQNLAAANEQRVKLAEEIEHAKSSAARTLEENAAGHRDELQAASAGETEARAALGQLQEQLAAELDRARAAQSDTVTALEERFDRESANKLDDMRAEFDAATQEREARAEQALGELRDQLTAVQDARAQIEEDAERAKRESATKEEELGAAFRQEFEAAAQKREAEAARALQELCDELNAARGDRARLDDEFSLARAAAAAAAGDLQREHAQKLADSVATLRAEFSDATQQRETEVSHALHQLHDQLNAAHGHRNQLAVELDQARAAADAAAASRDSWESRALVQLEADIETYRSRIKELLLERESWKNGAEAAVADYRASAETLAAERDALLKTRAELERRIVDNERASGEYQSRIQDLQASAARRETEHQLALDALRAEKDGNIASIASERTTALRAREQMEKRLADSERISNERKTRAQRLEVDLNTISTKFRENDEQIAALLAEHHEALTAQSGKHAQALTAFGVEKEAAISAIAAERDDAHQSRAELARRLSEGEAAISDHLANIRILEADVLDAQTSVHKKDNEISRLGAGHQDEVISLTQNHQRALGALVVEKDAALDAVVAAHDATQRQKMEIEQRLAAEQQIGDERHGRIQALDAALAETQTALADTQAALQQTQEEMTDLVRDHRETLTAHGERHERALKALATEKDAALAALAAANAALATETDNQLAAQALRHESALAAAAVERAKALADLRAETDRAVASITTDRDSIRSAKIAAEQRLGALINDRDEARRETSAVADRLAIISIESEKKIDDLEKAVAQLQEARQGAICALEEGKEAHKAQGAVFAREFKAVVKQRDEALAEITGSRATLEKENAQIEQERTDLARKEAELTDRCERDVLRIRRERDVAAQQRDDLRARFERLVEDQRDLLDSLNHEVRSGVKPKPAADAEPPPAKPGKTRESRKRSNVIDITEAEIVRGAEDDAENGLKIPRIRPMVIPPPNVRIL